MNYRSFNLEFQRRIAVLRGQVGSRQRRTLVEQARRAREPLLADVGEIGSRISIDPNSYFAGVFIRGTFEPLLVRFIKRHVKCGMTCLDIGANIGYFSLLMAHLVGPGGKVYAFEPTPSSYSCLCKNMSLNPALRVEASECALCDHSGTTMFNIGPTGYEVYNSVGKVTHPSTAGVSFQPIAVVCQSFDRFRVENEIDHVDFAKIDVEGSELAVLEGMEATLAQSCSTVLAIEFNDHATNGFGYSAEALGIWLLERGWSMSVLETGERLESAVHVRRRWNSETVIATKVALQ